MLTNLHHLMHIPVLTESGIKLGRIHDINFDIESQSVKSYAIKNGIFSKSYLIKPIQVISITKEKIIVDDTLIKDTEEKIAKKEKSTVIAGVAMSNEE